MIVKTSISERMWRVLWPVWTLALATSMVFAVDRGLTDPWTVPKWLCGGLVMSVGLLILSLFVWRRKRNSPWKELLLDSGLSFLTVCTLEAVLIMLQTLCDVSLFEGSGCGSFDNAAGASSCLVLGMSVPVKEGVKRRQQMVVIMRVLCAVGICLTHSRLGVFCMLWLMVVEVLRKNRVWVVSVCALAFTVLVFFVKTDSSRGRLFIYRQTMEMIAERPLTGWGPNGFRAHYMQRQANYFQAHPQSRYARLADNVRHPMSDVLLLAVDFGLVAALLCVCCLIGVIVWAAKSKSSIRRSGAVMLSCIMLLSLFSYPFHYPFTWLMMVYVLLLILPVADVPARWTAVIPMALSCVMAIIAAKHYVLEREWGSLSAMAERGVTSKVMDGYARLHPKLQSDPLFLYNEAAVCDEAGDEHKALQLIQLSHKKLSDYDLQLLEGDVCLAMGRTDEALKAYKTAGWMIPSRIVPLYAQYRTYQEKGDSTLRDSMRKVVLAFIPKVNNETVRQIKREVYEDVN